MFFLQDPQKFMSSTPPPPSPRLDFFWNSPLQYLCPSKNSISAMHTTIYFRRLSMSTSDQNLYTEFLKTIPWISMGYSRKKTNRMEVGGGGRGGFRIWNFQGYQRNSMWNFQGVIKKKEMEFPRVTKKKNNMEFTGVLVFGIGISEGSNTILWNFQRWSFVLSGISRGKVKKRKNSWGFQKNILNPRLFFFRNSPLSFCL